MKTHRKQIIESVLAHFRNGKQKAWIAREIGISAPTVHSYIKRFGAEGAAIKFEAIGRPKKTAACP